MYNNSGIGKREGTKIDEFGVAPKIIDLLLYARKASDTAQGSFGLKERLLFCLRNEPQPPRELTEALGMAKSNLAILAKACIAEGLAEKSRRAGDRRALLYSLTDKGRQFVNARLAAIEAKFATVLTDDKQRKAAEENLDAAVELLSFVP